MLIVEVLLGNPDRIRIGAGFLKVVKDGLGAEIVAVDITGVVAALEDNEDDAMAEELEADDRHDDAVTEAELVTVVLGEGAAEDVDIARDLFYRIAS